MLVRFITENFGSIRDRNEFCLIASKVSRHPGHVNEIVGRRVLRSAFVFGANAGGKTSFFKAIEFALSVVRKGVKHVDCARRYFRLRDNPSKLGYFQFELIADNNHVYTYGFVVDYSTVSVASEWLDLCDDSKKPVNVFRRELVDGRPCLTTGFPLGEGERGWFDFFKNDVEGGDCSQILILRDLARRAAKDNSFVVHAIAVWSWFKKIVMVSPEQVYRGGLYLQSESSTKKALENYLRYFDTGISRVVFKDVDYDEVAKILPSYIRDDLQHELHRPTCQKNIKRTATVSNCKRTYYFSFEQDQIRARQLMFEHGRKGELFEREEESDGTRRLFDLLPLLVMLNNGAIVVVDEVDRSLHTKATTEFIRQFLSQDARNGSQLIATTHDGAVLDLDLLRQDEIWFIERDEEHASHLFPLSKFNARFDKDVRKDYLLGRYGAVPVFRHMTEDE